MAHKRNGPNGGTIRASLLQPTRLCALSFTIKEKERQTETVRSILNEAHGSIKSSGNHICISNRAQTKGSTTNDMCIQQDPLTDWIRECYFMDRSSQLPGAHTISNEELTIKGRARTIISIKSSTVAWSTFYLNHSQLNRLYWSTQH